MTPIIAYLKNGRFPEEKDDTINLGIRLAKYVLIDEVPYKKGFSLPYLKYLAPDEANYLLKEVHEGACGNHSEVRALVHKVVHAGYF